MDTPTQEADRIVYRFTKSKQEEVRFTLRSYRERTYADIRVWFAAAENGSFRPTRKGFCFPRDYLEEMVRGMQRLAGTLRPSGRNSE